MHTESLGVYLMEKRECLTILTFFCGKKVLTIMYEVSPLSVCVKTTPQTETWLISVFSQLKENRPMHS